MPHLQRLADVSVLAFVVSSMLAMGMSQRLGDVVASLKEPRTVLLALIVNFVLSPLLTVALIRAVPLQPAHATGLLLLGGAAGAPFLPKLAELSGGHLAYSVALMMLLMVGSVVFMPLALLLIVPGVEADPWRIAKPLLLMLLPMAIGFALARSAWAARLLGFVQRVEPRLRAAGGAAGRAEPEDDDRVRGQFRDRHVRGLRARHGGHRPPAGWCGPLETNRVRTWRRQPQHPRRAGRGGYQLQRSRHHGDGPGRRGHRAGVAAGAGQGHAGQGERLTVR